MANKAIIQTDQAPGAIGTYSQQLKSTIPSTFLVRSHWIQKK